MYPTMYPTMYPNGVHGVHVLMFYCTPLFINGDIDNDVVDTDAYGEDNDDDDVYIL